MGVFILNLHRLRQLEHACKFVWPTPHFSLLLPEARSVNPLTQSNWEKVGVRPDVEIGADAALAKAHQLARQAGGGV
ncbi:hypothetical protein [Chromobacterium sp. IIBBL 290-4]|uniref:hypothetical protein n=1 Tax=Chromobacterium sp. IIBBL 290-4 TaxID=2953890 RepID=UPI0020B6578E|nr:hypothetical protein [Chromobacterium sp. IIBBL 290-4]UTH76397.1 hypothetical protein NKT35_09960 [Chromobacterium sp. IIBBL 290-4]